MKNATIAVLILALGYFAWAQSNVVFATTSGDHTTCSAGAIWCVANDGLWRKLTTDSAQVRVDVPSATPNFTSINCPTATQSNTGLAASSCTIK